MKVKDLILYQATTRDYRIGDIIKFGDERNFQAQRVFQTDYKMLGAENNMAEMFVEAKIKRKKKLSLDEMKIIDKILWNYGFSMRELGLEICRQKYYKDRPSRLTCMFLCDNIEDAKKYLSTAKQKGTETKPKVVGVKLNGNLFKTSNSFNYRGGQSLDDFIEQSKQYWNGVDDDFSDKDSIEYLFEGNTEVVEIIE